MNKSESLINCNTCKIRKVKCGRELPACSYCSGRDILCIYSEQIKRRGVSMMGLTSFIAKIKVCSSIQSRKLTSRGSEKNGTTASKFTLYKSVSQPISIVNENSQAAVTKIQINNTQNFQIHILLILSSQIINYDSEIISQIGFFVKKVELGVTGRLLKFSIHMNQEWIVELLSSSFEERCITSYFQIFHPMLTCLSKYKFYTNSNATCPVLKSVMVLIGYSSISKQNPELLKYLKHVAITQLKKNMFNTKITVCQAMLIFSCYLLFQGLGKQSLEYFHHAYLMASTLGIHIDMPGLNEIDKDERRCIRFALYKHDCTLCLIIRIQPHYLFLAPSWKSLNPLYQTNPHSKDPNEYLIAECICLSIRCHIKYWSISTNLMNKYSQITLFNSQPFSKDRNTQATYVLQTIFNQSLVRILDLHLSLSEECMNLGELEIVKMYARMHVGLYLNLTMIIDSQLTSINPALELDQSTKKQLWSAEALYQNSIDVNPLCLPMLYRNLCSVSLLYIKLILTYNHAPQLKELFLGKFKQVYKLFNSYRSKYNMPDDLIDFINIVANYYKIKL